MSFELDFYAALFPKGTRVKWTDANAQGTIAGEIRADRMTGEPIVRVVFDGEAGFMANCTSLMRLDGAGK